MSNGRRWKKNLMFRLGANVHSDLRWAKKTEVSSVTPVSGDATVLVKKRPRWQESVEFAGVTKQKRISNRWLSQSLMSSVGSSGSDVRVRDSFGTSLLQRKKLGMRYGFGVKFPHRKMEKRVDRASNGVVYSSSLFSEFELQLNVVRWRSGLVKSVSMADNMVISRAVYVYRADGSSLCPVYPSTSLHPGDVVQIDPTVWAGLSKDMLEYWSFQSNTRVVPPYLTVCFESGSVTVLWVPRNSDPIVPANMTISLKSFYKG